MLLEKPEMVPFRLTQNCVAVGVLGVTQSGEYVAVRLSECRAPVKLDTQISDDDVGGW